MIDWHIHQSTVRRDHVPPISALLDGHALECGRRSHRLNATCSRGDDRELLVCFFACSLQVTEEGGLGANITRSLEKTASRSPHDVLDRSRSAPGLSPLGETDCPDDARIREAWYDDHDLRNRSWEQVVGSPFACMQT